MKFRIGDIVRPKNEEFKEVVKITDIDYEKQRYYIEFLTHANAEGAG